MYQVLDNEGMNSKATYNHDYNAMLHSALNNMEQQGWTLAHIQQASHENDHPHYIFYKQGN